MSGLYLVTTPTGKVVMATEVEGEAEFYRPLNDNPAGYRLFYIPNAKAGWSKKNDQSDS